LIEQDQTETGHAPEECRAAVAGKTEPMRKIMFTVPPISMVVVIIMEVVTTMSTVAGIGMEEARGWEEAKGNGGSHFS